jgi:hypothetical protein
MRQARVNSGHEMSGRIMSDDFDGLDATEKAAIEAALNRCCALAAKLRANSVTRGPSTSLTSCRWQTFTPPLSALPGSSNRKQRRACKRSGAVSATANWGRIFV